MLKRKRKNKTTIVSRGEENEKSHGGREEWAWKKEPLRDVAVPLCPHVRACHWPTCNAHWWLERAARSHEMRTRWRRRRGKKTTTAAQRTLEEAGRTVANLKGRPRGVRRSLITLMKLDGPAAIVSNETSSHAWFRSNHLLAFRVGAARRVAGCKRLIRVTGSPPDFYYERNQRANVLKKCGITNMCSLEFV